MKYYADYMNNISVDTELHEKIMRRIAQEPAPRHRNRSVYRLAGLAACVAIVLICVWTVPGLIDRPNNSANSVIDNPAQTPPTNPVTDNPAQTTPNNPVTDNPAQATPDSSGAINPGTDKPAIGSPVQTAPEIGMNGAVYHDIDTSRIIYRGSPAPLPFGFFFTDRLTMFANNETGIKENNGVQWDSGQFVQADILNALRIPVNTLVLPRGDYTTEQDILTDEATGNTIAYKTNYIYFTLETMEFQRSFNVFSFSLDDFTKSDLEQSENIVTENGKIVIHDFPPPVVNTSAGIPLVRMLVYLHNGSAIVVEAITEPVIVGDTVDETKSLEKYEQSDKELIGIMQSLIA